MAYKEIYPDLFVDKDESIPEDIASHFIYPEFLYNIQADIRRRKPTCRLLFDNQAHRKNFLYHILCSTYVCIQFFPQKIAQKAPKQGESRWGNKSLSFPRFRRFYTKIRWITRLFRSFYSAKRLCGVCRRAGRPLPLRPALRHASNRKNKRGDRYLNICLKRRFSPVRALRISHKYTIFRLDYT